MKMNKKLKNLGMLLLLPVLSMVAIGCVEDEEYVDTHPRIAEVLPPRGKPGAEIVIKGRNLAGVTTVLFGDVAAEITNTSAESLTVIVPENAETGSQQLRVSSPEGTIMKFFEVQGSVQMPEYVIFNDALHPDWEVWGGWGGASKQAVVGNDPMEGAGTNNLVVSWTDPWGGFQLHPKQPDPFNLADYSAIRISIKGGEGFEGKQVVLQIKGKDGVEYADKGLVLTEDAYTTFVVPLSELGSPPSIEELRIKNEVAGTIYIDAFGLD